MQSVGMGYVAPIKAKPNPMVQYIGQEKEQHEPTLKPIVSQPKRDQPQ